MSGDPVFQKATVIKLGSIYCRNEQQSTMSGDPVCQTVPVTCMAQISLHNHFLPHEEPPLSQTSVIQHRQHNSLHRMNAHQQKCPIISKDA